MATEVPQFEKADGQTYDGCLVQLTGNGTGQWKHLGQFVKLIVFFPSP